MTRPLALFLAVLVLLQTLGPEVLVLNYQLRKAAITARYCVNKARPQLHCNGKCHLAQQLRKADDAGQKAPAGPLAAKPKFEALPLATWAPRPPRRWARPAASYPAVAVARCAAGRGADVFRPPLPRA